MSVLMGPATYALLNIELTSCPRTAAVLGELAAQWQQMMVTLQRVEEETVSSQNLAHAIENLSKTRSDVTGSRLRLKDGEQLHPKSRSGNTPVGESEEQVSPVLVIRERRHKMAWAVLVPRKGTEFPWIAKRAARFIDQLGHNRVALRCDNEPAIEALAREIGKHAKKGARLFQRDSQSNGVIERAVGLVAGQARTLKAASDGL